MTVIDADSAVIQPAVTIQSRAKAVIGGSLGNIVEWYDWYTYPSFALYFSKVFFPAGDQTVQLLNTAAVFAVGFLARPIGSWMMGVYADRAGRRAALILSMWIMGLGSLAVGLIPGYASIGMLAPVLLVVARLIQGLSLGGQYGASATYLSEMSIKKKRGLWTSFHYVTLLLGYLLAMVILLTLQATLTPAELGAWGWRIPFFVGAVLAVSSLWIILRLEETKSFEAAQRKPQTHGSTVALMLKHWRELGIVFVITGAGTIGYQTYATYMPKYLVNTAGFSAGTAAQITTLAVVVYMFLHPLFGWLSDIFGRRPMLVLFAATGTFFTVPILTTLAEGGSPMKAFLLLTLGLACLTPYTAVSALFKSELFPTEIRALGVGLPFALAIAVFGGTAELIALSFKQAGHEDWYYWYLTIIMAVAFVTTALMREPQKASRILED